MPTSLRSVDAERTPSKALAQAGMQILGISGSLRMNSFNTAALRAAAELLPPDVSLDIFDLSNLPMFNQDLERNPPSDVVALKKRIRSADALLIATPEHNYSISAALKNALDWGSRPHGDNAWFGKPAAIIGASPGGVGTARAQYHLRQMFVYLNVFPINQPEVMIVDAPDRFDSMGTLTHEATREYLRLLIEGLVRWTMCVKRLSAGVSQRSTND